VIKIKIDNNEYTIKEGTPVIDAARTAGKDIPSMCYRQGKEHITSCMVCMVKDRNTGRLFPSCSVKATDGMDIITLDDEIREARKTALELLLSEHVGDCEAPCQVTCPAHMNIPLMNRYLAAGKFDEALRVVKKDIALPSVFGRVCPAPCEGACHRKTLDASVSICLLKRYAGDHDLLQDDNWIPEREFAKNKSVAVIGAGPAGLATAWYLNQRGYDCVVYDRNQKPGGTLYTEVDAGKLPPEILEKEVSLIDKAGVKFEMGISIDENKLKEIRKSFDAVVIASGQIEKETDGLGLEMADRGIKANPDTCQVENSSIFVTGSALKPSRMAIRAHGQGKETAFSVSQYLEGEKVAGEIFMFNSRFGRLAKEEVIEYLKESVEGSRLEPSEIQKGFSKEEVMKEAARCMHCDCRDLATCKLRIYSDSHQADQRRFKSPERKPIIKHIQHDRVIYEPAKCIRCGICVDICKEYEEDFGLTFIGRGFDIEIGIPFDENLGEGLTKVAEEVVRECPTGALVFRE
jgi:ferredoxin